MTNNDKHDASKKKKIFRNIASKTYTLLKGLKIYKNRNAIIYVTKTIKSKQ